MAAPADTTDLWIRRFNPRPSARARLLVLPHAGGSASYFFPMSKGIGPDVEVVAAQYPGRQDRRNEPFVESVADLADLLVDIAEGWSDKPLALYGHSMGGSVGFELAVRLQAAGAPVLCLITSGRRAPSAFRDERVHERDDAGLVEEIKTLDGTQGPLLSDPDMLEMVLPPIRADYKAAELYRPAPGTPRLTSPIHTLIGDNDPKVTTAEAAQWSTHTTGPTTLDTYPGGHFFIADHAPAVNARIEALIKQHL